MGDFNDHKFFKIKNIKKFVRKIFRAQNHIKTSQILLFKIFFKKITDIKNKFGKFFGGIYNTIKVYT